MFTFHIFGHECSPVPLYEDYWVGPTKVPQIAEIRPLKRFRKLQRYIHFAMLKKQKIIHIDFLKCIQF